VIALFALVVDPTGASAREGAILVGVVAHLLAGVGGGWAGTRFARPGGPGHASPPRRPALSAPVAIYLVVLAFSGTGETGVTLAVAQVAGPAAGTWCGAAMGARR
jgi:hypothetical protein